MTETVGAPFTGLCVSQVHWWDIKSTAEHVRGFRIHYGSFGLKLACFSLCLTQDFELHIRPEWKHHFTAACSRGNNDPNWLEAKAQDSLQIQLLGRWALLYTWTVKQTVKTGIILGTRMCAEVNYRAFFVCFWAIKIEGRNSRNLPALENCHHGLLFPKWYRSRDDIHDAQVPNSC